VFVLHDDGAGYTMAVRSASGRSPLFWGADEAGDYALFSTSPAGRLSAFPQGCAFEVAALAGGPGPRVARAAISLLSVFLTSTVLANARRPQVREQHVLLPPCFLAIR